MNILLCLSHSIEEFDMVRLLHGLGHNVASIGGYIDPAHPHVDIRPPLPEVPMVPEVKDAVDALGTPDNLGAAQERLPEAILDWADVIIYHHYLDRLYGQWDRIQKWLRDDSGHRVIWRTVGQSVEGNEEAARYYHGQGLEIVRYSPKERNIPSYAGEDALIRFYKDPDEWYGWTGTDPVVINISQHDGTPHGRDVWLNWDFWEAATEGLPRWFGGVHSELIGGAGKLTTEAMLARLQTARAYLYTGTQPASYTLGLIEAMMVGIPVVSIGPEWMRIFDGGPGMFEGSEIAGIGFNDPERARHWLDKFLTNYDDARIQAMDCRDTAIALFGRQRIAERWDRYLRGWSLDEERAIGSIVVAA